MRAPDEFRSNTNPINNLRQDGRPDTPATHQCKGCEVVFKHRARGGNVFHSTMCKAQFTQNLRSAIRHIKANLTFAERNDDSIALAAKLLDDLPRTETPRQEMLLRELDKLDEVMGTVGPAHPGIRELIRARATAIAIILRRKGILGRFDERLFIYTREILRDVGIETPITPEKTKELLDHAEASVRFFLERRKHTSMLDLARSVMAWGNIHRILGNERAAGQRFTWTYHLLKEGPCRRDAPNKIAAWYMHQAISWRLRSDGRQMGFNEQDSQVREMARLADQVNDPRLWLQHYRDAAGHANFLFAKRDDSFKYMTEMSRRRKEVSSRYLDVTLHRPRIEFLFENRRNEEAIELVRGKYASLYSHHRDVYYYNLLQAWAKDHSFALSVPPDEPEFVSPLLTFLPRNIERPLV